MTTYICHDCEIRIHLKNESTNSGSPFAEVCPKCQSDDKLEYL